MKDITLDHIDEIRKSVLNDTNDYRSRLEWMRKADFQNVYVFSFDDIKDLYNLSSDSFNHDVYNNHPIIYFGLCDFVTRSRIEGKELFLYDSSSEVRIVTDFSDIRKMVRSCRTFSDFSFWGSRSKTYNFPINLKDFVDLIDITPDENRYSDSLQIFPQFKSNLILTS